MDQSSRLVSIDLIRNASPRNLLRTILLTGLVLRLLFVGLYADFNSDYYWEYGEIAKELLHGNGYSFYVFDGEEITHIYTPGLKPYASAHMPPGYVLFLLPYLAIDNLPLRNTLLLATHILLSLLSLWLLYRLTSETFSERVGLLAAAIGAVLPEFIYALTSFTPTILYHALIPLLFLLLLRMDRGGWRVPVTGLLLAVLVYIRAEFVLFVVLLVGLLILQKRIRRGLIIGAVAFCAVLPWSIRNYVVFDAFVPLTTGFGLNLYRGHNPYHIGASDSDTVAAALREVHDDRYELVMSREYQRLAFAYIKEHPGKVVSNSFVKFFWFFSYVPFYPESAHPLYLIPTVLLFLFGLYGLILTASWSRFQYFYLFFIASIAVVILFFPLPRYQTMMKILQLPFAAYGMLVLYARFRKKERPKLGDGFGR